MKQKNDLYLLLGANLGKREEQLKHARQLIHTSIGSLIGQSSIYETVVWGVTDEQPHYLNQVVCVGTQRSPSDVLEEIHRIEEQLGRVRTVRWGARVIDIDILFYGNEVIRFPDLVIPHRHFHERNFAMIPMHELQPKFVHPVLNRTIEELLAQTPDSLSVKKFIINSGYGDGF